MPITLGQLTANRKPLTIKMGDDELNIEYYPMRLTSEMLVAYANGGKMQELPDDQVLAVITSPGEMLFDVLADWDMVESIADDGALGPVLPITEETITKLGIVLQWLLVAAIMEDVGNQGKATAPKDSAKKLPSGASSSRTASSARSRTGTR